MATVNKRTKMVLDTVINGVDAGGPMTARIQAGYETILSSSPDGLQTPIKDRATQFVRGSVTSHDWIEAANLLAGTVGTLVFYERKSGAAAATGFVKHTITAPVIHNMRLSITKDSYAVVSYDFECRFASEAATIATTWAMTDSQAAPTYVSSARGGYRISAAAHGGVSIYHVMSAEFGISIPLLKECNDADLGYTAVDADLEGGMACGGSITFQDAEITASKLKLVDLLAAARGSLVLTLTQSAGATAKTLTIAGVIFTGGSENAQARADQANPFTAEFQVSNDVTTQLTLAGDNKILTIADVA
ncbi:MAG: hypothetical protein WC551_11230 [Patescibacteria group bacterium]